MFTLRASRLGQAARQGDKVPADKLVATPSGVMADSLRHVSTDSVMSQAVMSWILPFGSWPKIWFHLFENGAYFWVKQIITSL